MRVGKPRDVAALLGVHINTVYRMAQTGELPTLRRVGSQLRFDMDAIEDWLRDGSQTRSDGRAPSSHINVATLGRRKEG